MRAQNGGEPLVLYGQWRVHKPPGVRRNAVSLRVRRFSSVLRFMMNRHLSSARNSG
jgi:hypothetical protein